jgi:membrane protease YdiL (CAAX protease family)
MLATIYVVYKRIKKTSDVESVFNFSIGRLDKYLFIVPLTLVMMLWVDFFASLIPMPDWVADIFKEAFNLSIPNIIMIAIMAPLLEEVLVRGLVMRGYLLNYSPIKAIIASAIFFGLIHMNPWQFIGGFISGVFLGYLYYKTKSLIPSILVHFLNNSLSVVFSFFYVEADASFVDMLGSELYYVILIISIALGYVLYRKLDKILNVENIM